MWHRSAMTYLYSPQGRRSALPRHLCSSNLRTEGKQYSVSSSSHGRCLLAVAHALLREICRMRGGNASARPRIVADAGRSKWRRIKHDCHVPDAHDCCFPMRSASR
jgi:hypothetical protein